MKIIDGKDIFQKEKACFVISDSNCSLYAAEDSPIAKQYCYDTSIIPSALGLYCYCAAEQSCCDHHYFRRMRQNFYSVSYVFKGNIYYRMDKRFFIAEPGDVVILHPHHDTEILYPGKEETLAWGFCFRGRMCQELFLSLGLEPIFCLPIQHREEFEQCCKRLWDAMTPENFNHGIVASALMFECLQRISLEKNNNKKDDLSEQVASFLKTHLAQNISLSDLTTQFNISVPTLHKIFFQRYSQTPMHYLQGLRLDRAAKFLKETNESIKQITTACGFSSQQYFSASFSQYFGCSPTEYRKNNRC